MDNLNIHRRKTLADVFGAEMAVEARKLHRQGSSKSEIARRLQISRTSVRRLLAQKKS